MASEAMGASQLVLALTIRSCCCSRPARPGRTKAVLHSQNTPVREHPRVRGGVRLRMTHWSPRPRTAICYYVGLVVRLLCSLFLGGTAVCLGRDGIPR